MNKFICIISLLTLSACSVVGPGEKGVRITQGQVGETVLDSGWYAWIPFITRVKTISTRVQKTETETEAASKDMQKVSSKIAVNWHVDPFSINKLYQLVGDEDDVVERVINPAVSEVLKASTAKMTAEEILTRRIELKQNIDDSLKIRLKNYNILVDDVSLVNLTFTEHFNRAVEEKQVMEQDAKKAEYEAQKRANEAKAAVNQAKGEAESRLIKAKAEALAQQALQQSLTPAVLQMRYLEKWDGVLPQVLNGNQNSSLLFNLQTSGAKKDGK